MSGNNVNEAEISGYLKTLKGDNEEQLDVPAFLRRAQFSQRHIPAQAPAPAPQHQAPKTPSYNSWTR
jgi:hypothetical protein